MLISCSWLDSLMAPAADGAALDPERAAAELTGLGLEIEAVTAVGAGLESLVVGEVRSAQEHPKADRLKVVQLFDGREELTVICGAPNVPDPGGKVVFAPVGVTLPTGLRLSDREIRGVRSHGMICSETELDAGPDADGIIVLPEDWEPGTRVVDRVPGMTDTILELSITPNRPDALGHVGVARDLGVKLGRPLVPAQVQEPDYPETTSLVTNEATERCPRYLGFVFEDVLVGPSPFWLRVRLHRLGLRPISNVVDITNLVLLEWGQPLHAFDRARLDDGRIVVRTANDAEPMRTLDDRDLELTMDDLAICDASRPQALAGVMGGDGSGVEATTSSVLLEAAYFDPTGIRRTARRHQIATDSSYRFERGVDHGSGLSNAAWRACGLLQSLAGARGVGRHEAGGDRPARPNIALRPSRVQVVLGMPVPPRESVRILEGIEVQVDRGDPQRWSCVPPTHRPDLRREEDLIEELMRHHGLDNLPAEPSLPTAVGEPRERGGRADLRARLVDALRESGLHEVVAFVFSDGDRAEAFAEDTPLDRIVRVGNPMRSGMGVLRTHLLPGLLDALSVNVARHARPVGLFEVGRIYRWPATDAVTNDGPTAKIDGLLPEEPERAAVLLSSGRSEQDGATAGPPTDARTVGGILLGCLARLGFAAEALPGAATGYLHPGVQATLTVSTEDGARTVGMFGEVHPQLLEKWGVPAGARAFYGELHLDALPDMAVARYRRPPRFPATSRDVSLEVPVRLHASVVVDALREAAASVAMSDTDPADGDRPRLSAGDDGGAAVEVIEDYRGEGISSDHKALLVRLQYRAENRSVTDDEVQQLHEQIVARACSALEPAAPEIRRR